MLHKYTLNTYFKKKYWGVSFGSDNVSLKFLAPPINNIPGQQVGEEVVYQNKMCWTFVFVFLLTDFVSMIELTCE